MKKMTRSELAEAIAIDRAEYEIQYEGRESGWQPMVPFVYDTALNIAKRSERGVQGITVHRGDYGVSLYARIDWKKLAARVERQVPGWKATMKRMEEAS